MIRKNADWTEIADERILESLRDDGPSSPSVMAGTRGIRGSEEEIRGRCERLEREGLIIRAEGEDFVITDIGESYLEGDYDLQEEGPISHYTLISISEISPDVVSIA